MAVIISLFAVFLICVISDIAASLAMLLGINNFYGIYILKFSIIYLLSFLYVKCIDKRSIKSMGFIKKGAIKNYIAGLISGSALFLAVYLLNLTTGSFTFKGLSGNASLSIIFAFLFFAFQAMAEEVLFRGLLQISASRKTNNVLGILLSAAFFSIAHINNPGTDFIALVNIFLYGIFLSLLMLEKGNIFLVSGAHTAWNFTMGNIFGVNVSGLDMESTLFRSEIIPGKELLSGGAFGIEGGLIFTAVISIAIAFEAMVFKKKKEIKD